MSIRCTTVVGQMKNILSFSPSPPTYHQKYHINFKLSDFVTHINICNKIGQYLYLQFGLKEWQLLSFFGNFMLDELSPDVSFDNVTLPHITNPKKTVNSINMSRIGHIVVVAYLNIKQGTPSLWLITAFLENSKVCVRFFGRESLAKTTPTMNAWIITPVNKDSSLRSSECYSD